jgi:hypothetical protein
MAALYHVVQNLQRTNRATRLQHASLKLGAIVTYQINALIYRPAEGRAENILLEASCQHVPGPAGPIGLNAHPVMYQRGTYFLGDIINDAGAYRLPDVRPIDIDTLLALYRRDFMEDIEVEFSDACISSQSKRSAISHRSRKRKTTYRIQDYDLSSSSDADTGVEGDFEGLEMQRSVHRPTFDASPSRMTADSTISTELSAIQHQFPSDIFQLAPSPKSASISPWVLLHPAQRMHTKIDIFYSLDLSRVFNQVQYRVINDADWNNLVFQRYFPAKGTSMAKALQHFPSASYYRQWQSLMDRLDEDQAKTVQNDHLLQWFNKLCWVPHPESDRMWSTKKGGKEWIRLPGGDSDQGNCPRIAVNPRFHGKDAPRIDEEAS